MGNPSKLSTDTVESEGRQVSAVHKSLIKQAELVARVQACYDDLIALHGKRLNGIRMDRALYNLAHYSDVFGYGARKEGEERYIDPQPKDVVDIGTALLGTARPRIRAYAMRMTAARQRKASDIEEFMWAVIQHNSRRQAEPIYRLAVEDALKVGTGVIFTGWDPAFEGEGDEYDDLPLVVRYVKPEHFFWVPGGSKRAYSIQMEAYYRRADTIRAEWGKQIYTKVAGPDGHVETIPAADDTPVLYIDYWWLEGGTVYHAIVAGDTVLKDATPMPLYPDLPYTEIIGFRTSNSAPHLRAQSLLYPLRRLVIQKERMVNRLLNAIKAQGEPVFLAPAGQSVTLRPGAVIYYDPEGEYGPEAYRWIAPPGVLRDIYEALAIFEGRAQRATMGDAAYGAGQVASGVAGHLQLGASQIRLAIPTDDISLGWGRVLDLLAGLAAGYAGKKRLSALVPGPGRQVMRMKGSELKGWRFEVKLQAQTPETVARSLVVAANARQSGVMVSDRYLLEEVVGVEQPDRILEERQIEEMMKDPTLNMIALALAIEESGGDPAEVFGLIQGQQPGPPNAPMPVMPPTEGVPPGVMGQPLPQETGLPRGGVEAFAPEQELEVT